MTRKTHGGNAPLASRKPGIRTVAPMYQRLLVGTDGSPTATRAVEAAAAMARLHGAELVIAHAFAPRFDLALLNSAPDDVAWTMTPGSLADATLAHAAVHARAAAGGELEVHGRAEPGSPVPVLLRLVDELDPDALVIGNRDMRGLVRRHRSVGRALARRAGCDVVIIDTVDRRGRGRTAA